MSDEMYRTIRRLFDFFETTLEQANSEITINNLHPDTEKLFAHDMGHCCKDLKIYFHLLLCPRCQEKLRIKRDELLSSLALPDYYRKEGQSPAIDTVPLDPRTLLPFDPSMPELPPESALNKTNWQLRTPSGLSFKFDDPKALLGWKKKISTYGKLLVSHDGETYVDFADFVNELEKGDKADVAFETVLKAKGPVTLPKKSRTRKGKGI